MMPRECTMRGLLKFAKLLPKSCIVRSRKVSTTSAQFDALKLYHSFKKTIEPVRVNDALLTVGPAAGDRLLATAYCCGPTVYDHSHLGHAITYLRFDLFRRVLATYCNTDLIVGMGLTDLDDKIIARANESGDANDGERFAAVADMYARSFRDDMQALHVSPPHFYLPVMQHIGDIIAYIERLEAHEFAYINDATGDVVFDTARITSYAQSAPAPSIGGDEKATGKRSPRDFVLWKAAKLGEPSWNYRSRTGAVICGRPGWHVECSAVATGAFGKIVDFHYGGKDLAFPHHYNESACCHAFSGSCESDSIWNWSRHWLHSGHLVMEQEKMSKSLGNVVTIRNFLQAESSNTLRLLCIRTHYRTDFHYAHKLLDEARAFDEKLKRAAYLLEEQISTVAAGDMFLHNLADGTVGTSVGDNNWWPLLESTNREICAGIADDLDLNRGLVAMLEICNLLAAKLRSLNLVQLTCTKLLLERWLSAMGLHQHRLRPTLSQSVNHGQGDNAMLVELIEIRRKLRSLGVAVKKARQSQQCDREVGDTLLHWADELRDKLRRQGIVVDDQSANKLQS